MEHSQGTRVVAKLWPAQNVFKTAWGTKTALGMAACIDEITAGPDMLAALTRLAEKTERANAIHHSGGRILAEDWSELYQLTNEARAAIAKATKDT